MTNKEKIQSFAKNGYDDKPERQAFREMQWHDESFKAFIKDYAQLNMQDGPFQIIEDPLGEYEVDLGMIDSAGKIVCLIEVDVFNEWHDKWPFYYKCLHRLKRKTKYWVNNSYPYINVTFNTNHNAAIVTTREIESQYPIIDKWFKVKKMTEQLREVPISKTFKFGTWR
jgi:hypothetical protein|tara:strand:+ start:135 stop:641 length:507 start_codon:yes stop_codon:yes gene_type:complete